MHDKKAKARRFRRPISSTPRRWSASLLRSAPKPGTESVLADIMELNPAATVGFLSKFDMTDLRAYRDRLTTVAGPRREHLPVS